MSETEPKPARVIDFVVAMTDQAASLGWQKLGLQADFLTGKVHADLAEAKQAIDVTSLLVDYLAPLLDEPDQVELRNLLRNLRINYVEKAKDSGETVVNS